jgi:hypothetical protein
VESGKTTTGISTNKQADWNHSFEEKRSDERFCESFAMECNPYCDTPETCHLLMDRLTFPKISTYLNKLNKFLVEYKETGKYLF